MNKVLQDRLSMALLMVEDCLSAAHQESAKTRDELSGVHHDLSLLVVRGSDTNNHPTPVDVPLRGEGLGG